MTDTTFNINFKNETETFQYFHTGSLKSAKAFAEIKLHNDFIWELNGIRDYEIYEGATKVFPAKKEVKPVTKENNTMARAYEIRRNVATVYNTSTADIDFSTCLKQAWKEVKQTGKTRRLNTKVKIMNLIKAGYNTVEAMSEKLEISRKNVSSNLTYLRRELAKDGMTLTSERRNGQTIINLITVC